MASITEISPCCLPSCCGLKQCKISGGVNNLNVSPIACNLVVAWNLVVFSHVVASVTSIFPRCLQSRCIFTHGQIIGGFNNLHFPLLPALLLYFQTLPNHWWLQLLKFSPVACNLVVFSNIANSLVASITENFPCCLQSCCSLKQCKIPGGVNNLDGPPLPAVLLYFHALHNYWWLAWNLAVFSHMAK